MPDNFIFGVQSIAYSMSFIIKNVSQYQLFWGFAIGFFISTLLHAYIMTDNVKNIPVLLLKHATDSFQKMNSQNDTGTYEMSFTQHSKLVNRVKFAFLLACLCFLLLVIIVLIKF